MGCPQQHGCHQHVPRGLLWIASDNAAKAGVVVVAAAGNSGPAPYVTGAPSVSTRAISVAANNARAFLAYGLQMAFASGDSTIGVQALDSIDVPLAKGSMPAVIPKVGNAISFGCNTTDYPSGGVAGTAVIVSRGTCPFDKKTANATAPGASAIGVVNNADGFFDPLLTNPTIPFIVLQLSDTPIYLTGTASFNAFTPAISNALFVPVAANLTVDVPVSIDKAEFQKTPALDFMVVTEDNVSGTSQANLLKLGQ